MVRLRWPWAGLLAPRIAQPQQAERWLFARLPEWEETPERPQPAQITLGDEAIIARLAELTGSEAELRPAQQAYARAAGAMFAPRTGQRQPHMVLAQAGTFVEGMSAGRGFIAIAIVVLGRWRPLGVAAAAVLFGAATSLQTLFQSMGWTGIPYQLFLAVPYVLTLVVLAVTGKRGVRPVV